ncbi:MAG TPA: T9SS type A sorting domain-containing protein [Candidatus Kryptonia bacterium]
MKRLTAVVRYLTAITLLSSLETLAQQTFNVADYVGYADVYVADSTDNWSHLLRRLQQDNDNGWTDGATSWSRFETWRSQAASGGTMEQFVIDAPTSDYDIATVGDFTVYGLRTIQGFFGLRDGRSTDYADVRFVIQVETDSLHYVTLIDSTVTADEPAGWRAFSMDVSSYHFGKVKLRFITDPNGVTWEDWSEWADVSVSADSVVWGSIGTTRNVTFQADMSRLIAAGFNPSNDTISVCGGWPPLSWSNNMLMSQDLSKPNIYKLTVTTHLPIGANLQYKFHASPEGLFISYGWDTLSNNRYLIFPDYDTTLAAVDPAIWFLAETPLSVSATNFRAVSSDGSVVLSWQTQSEINNLGFNIFRKDSQTGTSSLIAGYISNKSLQGLGTSTTGRSYFYSDGHVASGHTYEYTVESVASDGTKKDYPAIQVTVNVPKVYALYQNYPNPFNPTTTISYDLPKASHVTITLYDMLGREVTTIVDAQKDAGSYLAVFGGSRFSSGVYFYKISAGPFTQIRKMVLMK